ncbi:hypothetical protein GCG54_00002958 [Colletotrichum gloeosporioides]|uniref:Uncharacterized protein n=1 Tax=Colletotrichum gloeosporioides TaxID=474922 RepID=A0A8H4CXR9_COLGL|nr:uncharacterized protein GCG54_00002958 [Colletotrichum gloeosporioides]KAF3812006.1 hypothetical protein GCG54_00002958 [Colletotrichum gloeosporioides]
MSDVHRHPPRPRATRARPQTGTRSSPLSIQPAKESPTAILADRSRATRVLHSRVPRISFINQGGICGSCREPRIGRIL